MTDLEILILLKKALKDHLNAPSDKKPSFLQLLDLVKFIRQQIIEDHKTKTQLRYDNRFNENQANQ